MPATTKMVNGVPVPLPPEEAAAVEADWQQWETEAADRVQAELAKLRQQAKDAIAGLKTEGARLVSALAVAAKDEFNILRAQTIGVVTVPAWDPANIPNGSGLTSPNVTVPGARYGDQVYAASLTYSTQGLVIHGFVVANDTVAFRLQNGTGAAVNLVSGAWKVVVRRDEEMPPRTNPQLRTALLGGVDTDGLEEVEG